MITLKQEQIRTTRTFVDDIEDIEFQYLLHPIYEDGSYHVYIRLSGVPQGVSPFLILSDSLDLNIISYTYMGTFESIEPSHEHSLALESENS